jgi:hypothetical protein
MFADFPPKTTTFSLSIEIRIMKKVLSFAVLLMCYLSAIQSQDLIWEETFGTGCNQGQLATTYVSPNGNWTMTNTGTNAGSANTWYVSAMENGMNPGQCGTGCGSNRTLHVGNITVLGIQADQGASYYDSGVPSLCGLLPCGSTNRRIESPSINGLGYENLTVTFDYIEGGNATDNATLWYFNGTVWSQLEDTPKTLCCGGVACNGSLQGLWTERTVSLPVSSADNPGFKIGFRWINNDDGVATDPSFAVDNIRIFGSSINTGPEPCAGDFNDNGVIDFADLNFMLSEYGSTNSPADLNGDGEVNFTDLSIFLSFYGSECP